MLWDGTADDFHDFVHAVARLPRGADQVQAAEELLSEAQRRQCFASEFIARCVLTEALFYEPPTASTLTHYAWLRKSLDDERVTAAGDRSEVFWRLKWALELMRHLPEIGLVTMRAALDDTEAAFRREGYALRPILVKRALIAADSGDEEQARAALTRLTSEPFDSLSDCEPCDLGEQGEAWESIDPARARECYARLIGTGLTCSHQPALALAQDALLAIADGDLQTAARQITRSARLVGDDASQASAYARCLVGWTRLGNVDRALASLADRLGWWPRIHEPEQRFRFASAVVLVIDAAEQANVIDEQLGGRSVTELRAEMYAEAIRIARAFDDRNGSFNHTRLLKSTLDLARISADPALPVTLAPKHPAATGEHGTRRSIVELAGQLRHELEAYSFGGAALIQVWLAHRSGLLAEAQDEDDTDIAFLDRIAAREPGAEKAESLLANAFAAAQRAGDRVALLRIEAEQLVQSLQGSSDTESLLTGTERTSQIGSELESLGAWQDAAAVWRLVGVTIAGERATEFCLRSATCAEHAGDPLMRAVALVSAAESCAPAEAAEHVQRSEELVGHHAPLRVMVVEARARLLARTGELESAAQLLESSLVDDVPPEATISARVMLCHLLAELSAWDGLHDQAQSLCVEAEKTGNPWALVQARRFLGAALLELGNPTDAAELLESILPKVKESAPELVGPTAWALGSALLALDELSPARQAFATAALGFEAHRRLDEAAHAQARAGEVAVDLEQPEVAAMHYEAARDFADSQGNLDLYLWALRGLGTATFLTLDEPDLSRLDEAPGALATFCDRHEIDPGTVDFALARHFVRQQGVDLLANAGYLEEACARAAHPTPDDVPHALRREAVAKYGLLLVHVGQSERAAALLRPLLTDPGLEADQRHGWAGAWASGLDRAGDTAQAEQVWAEFGPDDE